MVCRASASSSGRMATRYSLLRMTSVAMPMRSGVGHGLAQAGRRPCRRPRPRGRGSSWPGRRRGRCRPGSTKSEISIWRDFFGSALSSSSSVRMTYSPPPRSKPRTMSVVGDLLAGPLVDLLVADAVRGPVLELVEVDALVRGRRVQPDGDVHQPEAEGPLPNRAWHAQQITSPEPVHHLVTAIRHTECHGHRACRRASARPCSAAWPSWARSTRSPATSPLSWGFRSGCARAGRPLLEARGRLLRIRRADHRGLRARPGDRAGSLGRALAPERRAQPGRLRGRPAAPGRLGVGPDGARCGAAGHRRAAARGRGRRARRLTCRGRHSHSKNLRNRFSRLARGGLGRMQSGWCSPSQATKASRSGNVISSSVSMT